MIDSLLAPKTLRRRDKKTFLTTQFLRPSAVKVASTMDLEQQDWILEDSEVVRLAVAALTVIGAAVTVFATGVHD